MQRIARLGDVQATASAQTKYETSPGVAAAGTWAPGPAPLTQVTARPATAEGLDVLTSASCTFTFTGMLSGQTFTATSLITLDAAPHPLRVGGRHPLVDTDHRRDSFGNEVRVSSSATWRTS